ncbi:helix-turn-helix domain-containing protein [Roseomonas aerophila]|uniref:Helix-turn-helix domain-containing protein n=1 Tax=Teichococcus aerophilus TaxID=1224513 RepID=A0ABR7RNQ5_9PROT|nr:helix-turn-helix domain-containing protein [Pseudoroseomonas aerophila]MBC9207961.1 helix-turn-helix domain-containing protein [Pseudoroseomonas aerophila]
MKPSVVATGAFAAREQFDAWCAWFQGVFAVQPNGQEAAGFLASSTTWTLDSALLCRVATPPIKVKRDSGMIRRDHLDHWNIAIGLGGAATGLESGPRNHTVPSGVPFIISLGNPLSSERAADERLQLYFSRDQFPSLNATLDMASGHPLNTPLGLLLADFMKLLERNLPEISAEDQPRLSEALRAMLAACIAPTGERLAEAQMLTRLTQMERIRVAVRQRMASSRLGPAMLCREVGISRSQLYRILESEGGVARYILQFRLNEAFARLSDTGVSCTIATIAAAHGFADASTFSRSFRREFGVTPTEVRAAVQSGVMVKPRAKPVFAADALTLQACLRGL